MKQKILCGALLAAPLLSISVAHSQTVRVVKAPPTQSASGYYVGNRAPLQGSPFLKSPPGAVAPRGWLGAQLRLDADGLAGKMPEIKET